MVVNAGGLGALSVAFATYLGFFVPLGPVGHQGRGHRRPAAPDAASTCVGVKAGAMFSNVFTVLKLRRASPAWSAVGLALGSPRTTDFSLTLAGAPAGLWSALALGMVGVLWSYGGWQHATYASAEVKNPQRTLPLRHDASARSAVTAIYLLANLAYMFLLTPAQMAASPARGRRRREHACSARSAAA